MLRSILSRLRSSWRDEPSEPNGGTSEQQFRRSELDASVLYAHGADVGQLEETIADIEEQAGELENRSPKK